jgi:hypothetical protein
MIGRTSTKRERREEKTQDRTHLHPPPPPRAEEKSRPSTEARSNKHHLPLALLLGRHRRFRLRAPLLDGVRVGGGRSGNGGLGVVDAEAGGSDGLFGGMGRFEEGFESASDGVE